MYAAADKVETITFRDRASFKLAALFCLTFLAFFIGWLVYDVFTSLMETRAAEANLPNQPAVVEINPKIETELAKVLAYDDLPETADIKDPFDDQSGISDAVKTSANAVAPQPASRATTGATAESQNPSVAAQNVRSPSAQSVGRVGPDADNYGYLPQKVEPEDTKTRLATWEQTGRFSGSGEPEPQIFAIDDLIPVGVVSGGNEKQEVIFFSQAANRTFSFPVGTRFYDAWLMEVRPDGVVFTFDDGYRTSRLKSWGRSVGPSNTGEE